MEYQVTECHINEYDYQLNVGVNLHSNKLMYETLKESLNNDNDIEGFNIMSNCILYNTSSEFEKVIMILLLKISIAFCFEYSKWIEVD